jgi:hypothetical protein
MKTMFWLATIGFVIAIVLTARLVLRKFDTRRRAEEARAMELLAQASAAVLPKSVEAAAAPIPPVMPPSGEAIGPQKLLFEAAHKAGEAGEPALAIQLYARLLARYPQSTFGTQARAAVEAQKKKLAKA